MKGGRRRGHDETSPPTISASGRGPCCTAGSFARGAAAEKSGDAEKARAHYAAAIALTQNADPVRPQIAQARAFVQGGGAR